MNQLPKLLAFLFLLCCLVPACGSDVSGEPGDGVGSGDDGPGGPASDDTGAGDTGTDDTGDGDTGDGDTGDGDEAPAQLCPPGLEGQVPDLEGRSLQFVAAPPDDGFPAPGAFEILEGPVWIDGALHVSHIAGGGPPPRARILRLEGGALQSVVGDAGANGLAVDSQGRLVAARHVDGTVSVLDLDQPTGAATPLVSSFEGARFNSPNDLVLSRADRLYFTDPDWQSPNPNPQAAERAYHVRGPDDVASFASEVTKPNGIALSLDETSIYVGGTNGLFKYAVDSGGTIGAGGRVDAIEGGVDGLGKDCAGNLYVTGSDRVTVLTPADVVVGALPLAGVTNVAFGGAERTTLYATTLASPAVYAVELTIPGFPY